jgi:hypothetical protein
MAALLPHGEGASVSAHLSAKKRCWAKSRASEYLTSPRDLTGPLAAAEFAQAAGSLREQAGRTELLVPAALFQREFPDVIAVMREPRGAPLSPHLKPRVEPGRSIASRSTCRCSGLSLRSYDAQIEDGWRSPGWGRHARSSSRIHGRRSG